MPKSPETPELPKSYWHDVNRYCGEIWSQRPPHLQGGLLFGMHHQEASWASATDADKTASLETAWLKTLSVPFRGRHNHFLRLKDRQEVGSICLEYTVVFSPKLEELTFVNYQEAWNEESYSNLRTLLKYVGERNKERETNKELGLHIPHEEDYTILLDELRRGAQAD